LLRAGMAAGQKRGEGRHGPGQPAGATAAGHQITSACAGGRPGANVVSHRSPPCHAGETTRPTTLACRNRALRTRPAVSGPRPTSPGARVRLGLFDLRALAALALGPAPGQVRPHQMYPRTRWLMKVFRSEEHT